jgi:hypothetical protein
VACAQVLLAVANGAHLVAPEWLTASLERVRRARRCCCCRCHWLLALVVM